MTTPCRARSRVSVSHSPTASNTRTGRPELVRPRVLASRGALPVLTITFGIVPCRVTAAATRTPV